MRISDWSSDVCSSDLFGLTGKNAAMPCYDLIAEGYSSVMDLTGPREAEPQKVGAPAADMLAGCDAAMAVLAGLHRRAATGKGCTLDISLTESMNGFIPPPIRPIMGESERLSGGERVLITGRCRGFAHHKKNQKQKQL